MFGSDRMTCITCEHGTIKYCRLFDELVDFNDSCFMDTSGDDADD